MKHAEAAIQLKRKSFTGSPVALHFSHLLHDGSSVLKDLILNRDLNIKKVMSGY